MQVGPNSCMPGRACALKHTCDDQTTPLHNSKAMHTAAMSIETVLLKMPVTPASDSFHFAAILCLPANAVLDLFTCCGPALLIEIFPRPVCSLLMTQVSPVLACRTDTAQVLGRQVGKDVMQGADWEHGNRRCIVCHEFVHRTLVVRKVKPPLRAA